jgi:beta-lactamase superfamily II metal-dependent hydrolase
MKAKHHFMRGLALASVLALSAGAPAMSQEAKPGLRVIMVDVEGGGGTLFITPEGKSFVIDAGFPAGSGTAPGSPTSVQRIVAAAKEAGLSKIDVFMVSHYHGDHVGGVKELAAAMPIDLFVDHGPNIEPVLPTARPGSISAQQRYDEYLTVIKGKKHKVWSAGDRIKLGSMTIDVVNSRGFVTQRSLSRNAAPVDCANFEAPEFKANDENDNAVGVVVTFGRARVMSLADTTIPVEKRLLCPTNRVGPMDLLVVSHHGSLLSTSAQLLDATRPRVALVGNGATKGGDKRVFDVLVNAPSRPEVWQLHSATRNPEMDAPAERISNLVGGAPDQGFALKAVVTRDGDIHIENARNGFARDYPAPR